MKYLIILAVFICIACQKTPEPGPTPTPPPVEKKSFISQGESILIEAEKK
jgi:hypothetical protein